MEKGQMDQINDAHYNISIKDIHASNIIIDNKVIKDIIDGNFNVLNNKGDKI